MFNFQVTDDTDWSGVIEATLYVDDDYEVFIQCMTHDGTHVTTQIHKYHTPNGYYEDYIRC